MKIRLFLVTWSFYLIAHMFEFGSSLLRNMEDRLTT